jgi:transposase-like protein
MSKKTRRHLSTEKKAELIRKHLVDKKPISKICDENELQPSVFYGWLRKLMANAESRSRTANRERPMTAPSGS